MSNFNARIKLKRDTAVNWTVNNPVLLNGEIILIDTDSGELRAKVGDGTKTYTQLPFTDEILRNLITNKQNKLTGTQGQVVGFDEDGNAIAQDKPVLYVNITTTDEINYTSDKTVAEIVEAIEQGYSVIAKLILSDTVCYTLNLFYIVGEGIGTIVNFSGTAGTTTISATLATDDTTLVEMETTDLQSSIKGTQGQVVGFNSQGKPIAQNDKSNTAIQLDYANMKSLHGLGITDLNNVTEPGTYVGMSNGTTYPKISNIPNENIAMAFYLEVHRFIGPSSTDFEGYAMIIQNIYSMVPNVLAPSCGFVRYGIISSESEIQWDSWGYFAMPFITGTSGQVVGFDSQGKPVAQEAPSGLPEGGTDGKILGYSSSGPQWIDAPKTTSFVIQAEAPSDTSLLWINNTEHTLNYWDGSAWVKTVGVWG